MADTTTYPLILLRMSEFAEYVFDSTFRNLFDQHLPTMAWLPHSLLNYLQQYFAACTPAAIKPGNIRAVINGSPIPPRLFSTAETFWPRIMDIMKGCIIGGNMGLLSTPPDSYVIFFPHAAKQKRKLKEHPEVEETPTKTPRLTKPVGFLINTGEKKLPPANRLSVNPCYTYLVNGACSHENCRYYHGTFPKDYSAADRLVMCQWVDGEPTLSWKPAAQAALTRLQVNP